MLISINGLADPDMPRFGAAVPIALDQGANIGPVGSWWRFSP